MGQEMLQTSAAIKTQDEVIKILTHSYLQYSMSLSLFDKIKEQRRDMGD